MIENVHINDYGFAIQLTLVGNDGVTVEDISSFTTLTFNFYSPDGTTTAKTAVFLTDGTDGNLIYTIESGLLDTFGQWSVQAVVSKVNAQLTSDQIFFYVYEALSGYINVEELKRYLGIVTTNSDDDSLLAETIRYATDVIEQYTNKIFKVSSATNRYFNADEDVYKRTLYLDKELAEVTTVTNGDSTVISSSDYITEPPNDSPFYSIRLKLSANTDWTYDTSPENAITVNGYWGWSKIPPHEIKNACLILSAYYYRLKDSGLFETTTFLEGGRLMVGDGIPKAVISILDKYVDYRIF